MKEQEVIKRLNFHKEYARLSSNRVVISETDLETVLNMLKENSAELAEKSAEIEKYKSLYNKALEDLAKANRKNIENKKVINLMVKAMNKIQDPQICKYCDNNINLNHGYCTDTKKCKEGIKQYFERKSEQF